MEFSTMNYFQVDNNNTNNASMKRKHEQDPQEEQYNSQKRMHLIDPSTQTQQEDMMVSSLPSPPPTTSFNKVTNTTFQLSANATANRANVVLPSTPPEDVMMEDESTDEDEVLQTPSTTAVRYIAYDVGDDLDQGGFIGSLERGWSEMFNEMY